MPTTGGSQFDSGAYKRGTREQWQNAAAAWHRWGPTLETWLGPATELMLDLAQVGPGSHVLDVAAGAGGQTLAAARRVGVDGAVLATDISPALLEYASGEARRAGLANVATREMDGEQIEVEPESFDAVISRVGLIYFPDQQAALRGMRNALRSGGRVAAIVYSTPDRNRFFSIPVSIIRRRANLPPPCQGSRVRSASGRRAFSSRLLKKPATATSKCASSRLRCTSARQPNACASNRSRLGRCTRCSPASRNPRDRKHGSKSRRNYLSSKDTTGSPVPASCWLQPASSSPAQAA
jgi:SAM-dependent methyltransferase